MKKARLAFVLFASLIWLSGCGDSSSSGNKTPSSPTDGTDVSANDLGYDPYQRWQESGDYSYNFDYSYNGSHCVAQKRFNNKAQYCLGLQDQKLNSDCALPIRKQTYKNECGNDFQEINFENHFSISGFDQRLQKRCETGQPSQAVFKTIVQYCEFLKDEKLHRNCFWDRRAEEFNNRSCKGNFSQEPVTVAPQPPTDPVNPPNPPANPPNPPSEPADPLDQVPVVKELRSHGIEVSVDWQAIRQSAHVLPGTMPISEHMKIVWSELEANKEEIYKRKSTINQIEVTIYTNYHNYGEEKTLYLDYETKAGHLAQYFPLLDQILKDSEQLGIDFDIIHSGFERDSVPYLPLRQMLSAVQKNWNQLTAMKGVIETIKVDTYAAYFTSSKTLTLKDDDFDGTFAKYVVALKPLAPVYSWAKANRVELDVDFDLEKDGTKVQSAFSFLEKSLPGLDQMVKAKALQKITIRLMDGEIDYWTNIQTLILNVGTTNQSLISKALNCLGKQAQMSLEIHKTIDINLGYTLDDRYFAGFARLERFWSQIKARAGKLEKITIASDSKYYSGLKELYVGSGGTDSDLQKAISEIN